MRDGCGFAAAAGLREALNRRAAEISSQVEAAKAARFDVEALAREAYHGMTAFDVVADAQARGIE